jgi:hypothetical protein
VRPWRSAPLPEPRDRRAIISVRESQPDVARDVALRVSDAVKLRQSILKELSLGCSVVLNEIRENERS